MRAGVSDAKIIWGFHAITSRLRQKAAGVREVYIEAARDDRRARDLAHAAQARGVRVVMSDSARLDGITGHARHQGVAARVDATAPAQDLDSVLDSLAEPALLLILDGVTDPHNLGACLRVADAMGVHAVVVPKDRAAGITPAVEKVASGAVETVPLVAVTNLARAIREIKERTIWVIGAEQGAIRELYAVKLVGPLAWVLGAEGEGMRRLTRESCDELVRIPMLGVVETLNVSVSAGICLAETRRQRQLRS
jgi:23S rRNA (guanosine2251-2'-O)-methyltransferase